MGETDVDELAGIIVAVVVACLCLFIYFVPIPDPTLEELRAEEQRRADKERVSEQRPRAASASWVLPLARRTHLACKLGLASACATLRGQPSACGLGFLGRARPVSDALSSGLPAASRSRAFGSCLSCDSRATAAIDIDIVSTPHCII